MMEGTRSRLRNARSRSSRVELPHGTERRTVAGLAGGSRANIKHVAPQTMIEAPRFTVADLYGTEAFVVGSVSFLVERTKA
jgi:hypothetical protein